VISSAPRRLSVDAGNTTIGACSGYFNRVTSSLAVLVGPSIAAHITLDVVLREHQRELDGVPFVVRFDSDLVALDFAFLDRERLVFVGSNGAGDIGARLLED
jgi:hypothetical protein